MVFYSYIMQGGQLMFNKARQSRCIVSHQPLTRFACGRAVIIPYSLLATTIIEDILSMLPLSYTLGGSTVLRPLKLGARHCLESDNDS